MTADAPAPLTRAQLAAAQRPAATPARAPRLSFLRLVRGEWIKLRTLRAPWWSAAIVVALSLGLSSLLAFALRVATDSGATGIADSSFALRAILGSTSFTVLLATILGSIQVTGEYSTGMIRSTFTADPGRIGSLFAKNIVVALFVFAASLVGFGLSALVTAPILSPGGIRLDLGDPGSWILPILAGGLTMAVIASIGVSAGFLLRNGAGAISVGVGIVFVLPLVSGLFAAIPNAQWIGDLVRFLPTNAGQALMFASPDAALPVWGALVTLAAWVVAGLVGSIAVLRTRDA